MKPNSASRRSLARIAAKSFGAAFVVSGIAALGFGSLAGAQDIAGFDSSQPVNYAADRIELQDRQQRVVLSGDVVINQGDLRLTAGRTTVSYTNNGSLQIQRIDATGGVTVTRGSDTLNGGRLTMDLNSGLSSVDGTGATGPQGGRVTGSFSVPEN